MDYILGVIEPEVVQEGTVFRECLRANAGARLEGICSSDRQARTAAARGRKPASRRRGGFARFAALRISPAVGSPLRIGFALAFWDR